MSNQAQPKELEKIHREILEEMNRSTVIPWLENLQKKITAFLDKYSDQFGKIAESIGNIIKFIGGLPPFILFLLLLAIIVAVILLIIFIVKKGQRRAKNRKIIANEKVQNQTEQAFFHSLPSNEIFDLAITHAKNGEYEKAIITLHRGSVYYLHKQKKLHNDRDYTNKEICLQLNQERFPFQTLALRAEKILFGYQSASEEDFIEMKNLYRENFYG